MYTIEYKVYKSDITTLLGIIVSDSNGNVKYIPKDGIHWYTYTNQKINKAGHLYSGKGSSHIHIDAIRESSFKKLDGPDFRNIATLREALKNEPKFGA